jgi:hypothetical protein
MVQHVQGSMAAARWARARAEGGGRGGRKRLADSEPHRRAARRSVGPAGAAKGGRCIFFKNFTSLHFTSLHFTSLHFTSLHFKHGEEGSDRHVIR